MCQLSSKVLPISGEGCRNREFNHFVKLTSQDYDSEIELKYCILSSIFCNKPELGFYNDFISRPCLLSLDTFCVRIILATHKVGFTKHVILS